ncbi:MAG: hypothetical protein MI749_16835, partial [Desulfovibrionales bacterium]|nr:hypothetical protein [Desulfovibrionales bacterium]
MIKHIRDCRPPSMLESVLLTLNPHEEECETGCTVSKLITPSVIQQITHIPRAQNPSARKKAMRHRLARADPPVRRIEIPTESKNSEILTTGSTTEAGHFYFDSSHNGYSNQLPEDTTPAAEETPTIHDSLVPSFLQDWLYSSLPLTFQGSIRPEVLEPNVTDSLPTIPSEPVPVLDLRQLQTVPAVATDTNQADNFAPLTEASNQFLINSSPVMAALYNQVQAGQNPLASTTTLSSFIDSFGAVQPYLYPGNRSLVIRFAGIPGHVLKIARSLDYLSRFNKELALYRDIHAHHKRLKYYICPLQQAFRFAGLPVLAMRAVDFIAERRLKLISEFPLFDRLNFALAWLRRFCEIYLLFLEEGLLLADR